MNWKDALGEVGESFAASILQQHGLHILTRNYRSRYGEVDIVAADDEVICFVEVKTRHKGSLVSGEMAITKSKQRRIITTALLYIQEQACDLQPRFDVLTVLTDNQGRVIDYNYLIGAFDGEAYTQNF